MYLQFIMALIKLALCCPTVMVTTMVVQHNASFIKAIMNCK